MALLRASFTISPVSRALCRISRDRKSTRLNSSHGYISYAVFCLKKKNNLIHYFHPTFLILESAFLSPILVHPRDSPFPLAILMQTTLSFSVVSLSFVAVHYTSSL